MPRQYKKEILNGEKIVRETSVDKDGKNVDSYYIGNCFISHRKPNDFRYVLLISTKEDVEDISKQIKLSRLAKEQTEIDNIVKYVKEEYSIGLADIHSLGTVNEVSNAFLNTLIPHVTLQLHDFETHRTVNKKSYVCYLGINHKEVTNSNIIIHESAESSWKCLMQKHDNPEYVVIIKEKL